jgi:hypothetical protein
LIFEKAVLNTDTKFDWVSYTFYERLKKMEIVSELSELTANEKMEYTDLEGSKFEPTDTIELMVQSNQFAGDTKCRKLKFFVTKNAAFKILIGRTTIGKYKLLQRRIDDGQDAADTGAIALLPEEPDGSSQPTEEEMIQSFFNKAAEARRLQRVVEQLTATIVDRPGPKSAVTLGNVLTSLESMILGPLTGMRIGRLYYRVRMVLQRTCIELQTCIECMNAIIEVAQGNLRQPSSAPDTEASIWMPGIDMENFASSLKSYTETMHNAATKIAEQYLGELSRQLAFRKGEDAATAII